MNRKKTNKLYTTLAAAAICAVLSACSAGSPTDRLPTAPIDATSAPTPVGTAKSVQPTDAPSLEGTKTPLPTNAPTPEPTQEPTQPPVPSPLPIEPGEKQKTLAEQASLPEGTITDQLLYFAEDGSYVFNVENSFSTEAIVLSLQAPEGAVIHYTMDGSTPSRYSQVVDGALLFEPTDGLFPEVYTFSASCILEDGTVSDVARRTFFVCQKFDRRFSTAVFSLFGSPSSFFDPDYGIFMGDNVMLRGRDSERNIFVEAFEKDGTLLFSQNAGVRLYGGYGFSRQAAIKSLKLFSRKSYDDRHKNFKFSAFQTPKLDGSDEVISKYDKLVLRSHGNDFQFLFIRDELGQALAKKAGFENYEACIPAVVFFNGKYYGLFWLHENYCDKYFKEKYGDADGEFIVLEGKETLKETDDEDTKEAAEDFNEAYAAFSAMDFCDDECFSLLGDFLDIDNYLEYMAFNVAIANYDWPLNNIKCFRYVPAENDDHTTGAFDGRYRFLPHDMDMAFALPGQDETQARQNTLKDVLTPGTDRFAPLLSALLNRPSCRSYFKEKLKEYLNGVLSHDSFMETYEELHMERFWELPYYYDHLNLLKATERSIFAESDHYNAFEASLEEFSKDRSTYLLSYLEELLPDL